MSERLAVDSLMTADGEVVQLPTMVSVSSMSVCGVEHFEHVKIPTYVDGYARGVKYCPFCGEEL